MLMYINPHVNVNVGPTVCGKNVDAFLPWKCC